MDVNFLNACLEETKRAYRSSMNNLLWLEQYRLEYQNYRDYEGREILELLQNADDAGSPHADIILDSRHHVLTIKNSGRGTQVFTDEGMRSIMASYLSPKKNDEDNSRKLIGAKGLGFKSILNWTSEITIRSAGIVAKFGDDVVREFWEELKEGICDADKYESEARRDGHMVPLPILRLPQISVAQDFSAAATEIELDYIPERAEAKIKKALEEFCPESLLFLHNLRSVKIDIDGEVSEYRLTKIADNNGIEQWRINQTEWLVSRHEDTVGDRSYEVAAAYNLGDSRRDTYRMHTFFPTDEVFPYPCLLHATLELNASRKAILTGEEINCKMMALLAERIIALAERLKQTYHDWQAYKLVAGNFSDLHKNTSAFALKIKEAIETGIRHTEYIPIISGGYARAGECYYYNDSIYDFVQRHQGSQIFEKMMMAGKPTSLSDCADARAAEHIEEFAKALDFASLAKFIKLIYDYHKGAPKIMSKANYRLLKDENGDIISGRAYLNTGRKIADIPTFVNIKYVDEELKKYLISEFEKTGTEQDQVRAIATSLSESITNISASDVSGVKRMLMLTRADEGRYSREQINEIIACLYKLYASNTGEFKKQTVECHLPAEGGGLRPAGELVFGDERFPDGFRRLKTARAIYEAQDYVAYPDFLEGEIDAAEPGRNIQDFYSELGVNMYFCTEEVCYGDDGEYLRANKIVEQAISNASKNRVAAGHNVVEIPKGIQNSDNRWKKLTLTELIRLICVSGLAARILEDMGVTWYYNRWFGPEPLQINYLAYLLKKNTAAGRLSNYIISTKEWIVESDSPLEYDESNGLTIAVLTRLGAKYSYADFNPLDLYELINAKARECRDTDNYTDIDIKKFYHKIKGAFVAMGSHVALPAQVSLNMLCSLNGEYRFLDSRQIFYSNNWKSKKLQEKLPILCLQLRDGEDEVNRIFGCKRVKDLKLKVANRVDNENLSRELNEHMRKCKPHILASVSKDTADVGTFDNDKKSLIDRIYIHVVKGASYSFEHEELHIEAEPMANGEMIVVERNPLLCSKSEALSDALADPRFCSSVAEAICVILNLSARENTDRFYRIIKSTCRELEYIQDTFNPDLWQSCKEAFGISADELDFWRHVFEANDKGGEFDPDKIVEGGRSYISESLNISLDRADHAAFNLHHLQRLRAERDSHVAAYKGLLHKQLCGNQERQYLSKIADFQSNEWIEMPQESRYLLNPDYKEIIDELINAKFDLLPEKLNRHDSPVPVKYQYDIEGLELNIEDESLLYFKGNEEYFKNLKARCATANNPEEKEPSSENGANEDVPAHEIKISVVDAEMKRGGAKSGAGNKRGRGMTRRKLSDSDLKKIGDKAEDIVLKALRAPESGYEVGTIYSTHLNPETGNDAQGYDLEYRRRGDSIYRCLEIKHFTGNSIIVSRHEYETARSADYAHRYDVALVCGSEIQIWQNAFSDDSKYAITSDDYTISFQTTSISND